MAIETYPEVVKKMYFTLLMLGNFSVAIANTLETRSLLSFVHISLNMENLTKIIWENSIRFKAHSSIAKMHSP